MTDSPRRTQTESFSVQLQLDGSLLTVADARPETTVAELKAAVEAQGGYRSPEQVRRAPAHVFPANSVSRKPPSTALQRASDSTQPRQVLTAADGTVLADETPLSALALNPQRPLLVRHARDAHDDHTGLRRDTQVRLTRNTDAQR